MQFACVKMDFVTYLINSQPKKIGTNMLETTLDSLKTFSN